MIEVNVTREKIEAFKDSLEIGAKVNYRTPVYSLEDSSRYTKVDNEAHIVAKLKYNATRGKGTAVVRAAMPYKEIYLQKMGYQY